MKLRLFILNKYYLLPQSLRTEFNKAYGQLFTSASAIKDLIKNKTVICIGDKISYNVIKAGYTPKIIIFDKQEMKRSISPEMRTTLELFDGKQFKVENPPGNVTGELWNAISQAIKLAGKSKISVKGEEDMAFLPTVLESSVGDIILYGFFDKGFVLTIVDNDLKKKCDELLAKMQVVEGP